MAVTITTKFYETWEEPLPGGGETWEAGEWHDLSKIVFTSPNFDSPQSANTRSHILPGGAVELGLWYEDSTYMYRIESSQQETELDYLMSPTNSGAGSFHMANSIVFEVTAGECYDCRLTAWDDVTHSTTSNELLAGEYYAVSAIAYYYTGGDFIYPDTTTVISGAIYNQALQGDNVTASGIAMYYGDFPLQNRIGASGDVLIFKPMLLLLDESISYGVHDFVTTLHYSYT